MASLNTATVLSTLDDLGMLDLGKEGLGGWDPEAWEAFDIDWNDANAGPENEDYGEVPVAPSGWEQIAKRVIEGFTAGKIGFCDLLGQIANTQDITLSLGYRNGTAGIQQIKGM